ncbi:MAG: hypothetical protein U0527_17190 [Candidatus Eisenbacteria bacterium]
MVIRSRDEVSPALSETVRVISRITRVAPLLALVFAALGGAVPRPVHAGVNSDGVLLLHTNPDVVYSVDEPSYCGRSGLLACEAAQTRADGEALVVVFAIASFTSGSTPRLAGAVFGVQYDDAVAVLDYGSCADFELASSHWPGSGEGTALAWSMPRTTLLTEVYWFAAYAYSGAACSLSLIPHPTQGAFFADDSVPSVVDPISALGRFGFNEDGLAPCPAAPPVGGCCLPSNECVVLTYEACQSAGGSYYGPNVPCSARPCPPPPPTGACCIQTQCHQLTEADCAAQGGYYFGDGVSCYSVSCLIGACCVSGGCTVLTEGECEAQGGIYRGDGAACESIDCALGACCIDGACFERNASDCAASGGSFEGEGTFCGFGLCVNVPCGGGRSRGVVGREATRIGPGTGLIRSTRRLRAADESPGSVATSTLRGMGCGTPLLHSDDSYEWAYGWAFGGVVPPDYGAFAECYSGDQLAVCSAFFDFTQVGFGPGQLMDVYVWNDEGGCPGVVLCMVHGVNPGGMAIWPDFSRHVVPLDECCVSGQFWVGSWGNWPGQYTDWYVGADLNGPGGCSKTNIAPGIGYPSGWNNVSVVWGPTQALGIGCEVQSCAPVAVSKMSWGKVKALYNDAR